MSDEDKHKVRYRNGRMQHWNRNVEDLQKPDLLQMRHGRQGGDGNADPHGQRTNHHVHWQAEDRGSELDRSD
eukprot:778667-Heterocapsa_arctica.AAC.1